MVVEVGEGIVVLIEAIEEVQFLKDPTAGELRVGAIQPMLQGLLPAILGRLSRRYPRIAFRIVAARTAAEHYRDLRERKIDLLIGRMTRIWRKNRTWKPKSSSKRRFMWWQVRDTLYCAAGISTFPSWRTGHGCCPCRKLGRMR